MDAPTRKVVDRGESQQEGPGEDRSVLRVGAVAGIVGSLVAMVGNLLHPATPTGDPQGVARAISGSGIWVADHLAIVAGLILMLGGLIAIARSISGGRAGAMARLGSVAAVAGTTVGLILVTLDGVAAKELADAWATAPPAETPIALRLLVAEETLNFALAALFNVLFAGVTFLLFGLAVAWSEAFPRWMGWIAAAAGLGSIAVGLVQASVGESTAITRFLTIVFPTVITLWVVQMDRLVLRMTRTVDLREQR
jgi:hypothetical protein